jgi:uncharacterized membrane protein YfcA
VRLTSPRVRGHHRRYLPGHAFPIRAWRADQTRSPAIQFLSPIEIAYCSVVMIASYALRGSTGFGAAAAMPLLALVVPLKVLIPAWTLIGLVASVTLFSRDRHHIAWGDIARLVPTCLIGVLAGLYLFTVLDSSVLARALGALVLLYGLHSLWGTLRPLPKWTASARIAAPIAGLVGGIVGTTFGTMASVFFAMYFDALRKGKEQFRGTMNAILLALVVLRGAGYWAVGEYTREALVTAAIALPMMLVGIFIGNRVHTGLSELAFRRLVSGALVASGLALLVKSG